MQIIIKKGIKHGYAKIDAEGKVFLTVPHCLRNDQKFIDQLQLQAAKLQQKIQKKEQIQIFSPEGVMLFGERVAFEDLEKFTTTKAWKSFFQQTLEDYARTLLDHYAHLLGYQRIPLRIALVKAKWGSCSADQKILLNQSLVHLPSALIRYVIVHEVAHLREKHHQKAFWDLVEQLLPDYRIWRKRLKNIILTDLDWKGSLVKK